MSEELVQRLRVEPTASHFLKPANLYQDLIAERSEAADRIEELQAQLSEWRQKWEDDDRDVRYFSKAMKAQQDRSSSQARLSEAVKVLEYYSGIHEPTLTRPNEGPWGVNSDDFGQKAREFLAALGEEK